MIIIPDIHGRSFWKEAVKGRETEEIVFLGDFLDPYELEGITVREAIENFKEILAFKKEHTENVILLVGNHDCTYIFGALFGDTDRTSFAHGNEIKELFNENIGSFQLAYEKIIDGKRYVFSHSGIHSLWLNDLYGTWDENSIVERLNTDFKKAIAKPNFALGVAERIFIHDLGMYSFRRGGYESFGSPVWADAQEFKVLEKPVIGDFCVVGHTQLVGPVITEYYSFLDCHKAFLLKEDGIFYNLDGTPVPTYENSLKK